VSGFNPGATRIYWTLYVAGLNQLSILEGGLLGYFKLWGREGLESGLSSVQAALFESSLREEEIMNINTVSDYIDRGANIVDARSPEEYRGEIAGSECERPGVLPGAVNLPFDGLMNATQSGIASKDELKKRFSKASISLTGEQLSYCHTGHRTALVWFAAHELIGNKQARLYDASTLEWSSSRDLPLVTTLEKLP
jgi:thiosulfate/3-mercaptopyruvate sulfurtransferase